MINRKIICEGERIYGRYPVRGIAGQICCAQLFKIAADDFVSLIAARLKAWDSSPAGGNTMCLRRFKLVQRNVIDSALIA